ncbi:MAG: hypothetical protein ACYDG5_06885, partial [Dehalococcoidales bacterium]
MGFFKGFITAILGIIFFIILTVFGVAFMVHGTALSADFVSTQVDKIPISAIARDITKDQLSSELPQGSEFLKEVAYNVVEEQETWIKTQLKAAVNTGYDYFLGKNNTLSITISLTELKANLTGSFWQAYKGYLQEQLIGKSDAEISAYIQDLIRQFPQDILPPELSTLPPDVRNLYIEQYLRDAAAVAPKVGTPPLDPYYQNVATQY